MLAIGYYLAEAGFNAEHNGDGTVTVVFSNTNIDRSFVTLGLYGTRLGIHYHSFKTYDFHALDINNPNSFDEMIEICKTLKTNAKFPH